MYQKLKYDNLFKNVIPNSVGGIKIFNVQDPYIISQKYDEVTNLENRIWSELFQNLEFQSIWINISWKMEETSEQKIMTF